MKATRAAKRFKAAIWIALSAAPFLGLGLFFFLHSNQSGFCTAQQRYLSDQEIVNLAIRHVLERKNDYKLEKVSDASITAFRDSNKNCCKVYRNGHALLEGNVRFWRLFGFYVVGVDVNERVSTNPGKTDYSGVFLDECGKALEVVSGG